MVLRIIIKNAAVLVVLVCMVMPVNLLAQDAYSGKFPPLELIEDELELGVSTTRDVERVLGEPSGYGGSLSINDRKPRKVWYYQNINASVIDTKDSVIRMHNHAQVLLVFFLADQFDGYTWYTTAGTTRAIIGDSTTGKN